MAKATTTGPSSKKELDVPTVTGPAETNAERAYKLRLRGKTRLEIMEEVGYSAPDQVDQAIQERFKYEAQFFTAEDRAGILALELARLDFMLDKVWDSVEYGDPVAIRTALLIHDRRVKIARLDAPDAAMDRATVLVVGGEEAAYITSLKQMVG